MAFLTEFSDQFTSEWNEENIYGKMDPIATFQRTGRKISVSWDVPADSYSAGYINLVKVQGLIKFLYPSYSMADNANSVSQSPIVRMKFANLIARRRGDSIDNGLLGYLSGMSFAPDMDAGFFDGTATDMTKFPASNNIEWMQYVGAVNEPSIAPKVIKLNCSFTVLHERQLGWGDDREWIDKSNEAFFPYQIPSGTPDDDVITGGGDFGGSSTDPLLSGILNSGGDLFGSGNLAINNIATGQDNPDDEADMNGMNQ